MKSRPDIVVLLTDQQSATMLGASGNRHVRTPAMDSLAARGTRFERAYCTAPLCVPSRFSLLTGLMPSAISLRDNDFNGEVPDGIRRHGLGRLLAARGYRCIYAGKQHLPGMNAADLGFEVVTHDERDTCVEDCVRILRTGHDRPLALVVSLINPHDICYMAIRDAFHAGVPCDVTIDGASSELRELDHALARPPGMDAASFFADFCPPAPANLEPQIGEPAAIGALVDLRPFRRHARDHWSVERWREHRWAYARLTERVDAQMGSVIAALDSSGRAGNTLVVMTSDHGDLDGAHRMEHKDAFYEEAARIPCILAGPGVVAGGVDDSHLVSNGLDLIPTLCAAAGAAPPDHLSGRNLLEIAGDSTGGSWRSVVPVENCIGRAIIGERWKYARYDVAGPEEELVDLREDPGETRNLAGDPAYGREIARCRILADRCHGKDLRAAKHP